MLLKDMYPVLMGLLFSHFLGNTRLSYQTNLTIKWLQLLPYDYLILHMGTNDIGDRANFENIIKEYANLPGIIRKMHPTVHIIFSTIIPRPCDYNVSDPIVRAINSHSNKVMSKKMIFKFVCTVHINLLHIVLKYIYMRKMVDCI